MQVQYCKDLGNSLEDGSLLLTYAGVAQMLGETTSGVLMDYSKSTPKIYIVIFLAVVAVLANVQVAFAFSYWALVLFSCVFGFNFGATRNSTIQVTMEFMFGRDFKNAYGLYIFSISCFQMAGPPAAGA